jgi:hypothetical protein
MRPVDGEHRARRRVILGRCGRIVLETSCDGPAACSATVQRRREGLELDRDTRAGSGSVQGVAPAQGRQRLSGESRNRRCRSPADVNLPSTIGRYRLAPSLAHATLGPRPPPRQAEARIPTVAWTSRTAVDAPEVNFGLRSRRRTARRRLGLPGDAPSGGRLPTPSDGHRPRSLRPCPDRFRRAHPRLAAEAGNDTAARAMTWSRALTTVVGRRAMTLWRGDDIASWAGGQ